MESGTISGESSQVPSSEPLGAEPAPQGEEPSGTDDLRFWRRRLRDPLFVYVIRGEPDSPIKVGLAKDVNLRMTELQTGNPRKLVCLRAVPGDRRLEWNLHVRLEDCRMMGEWFDGPEVAEFLAFVADLGARMRDAMDLSGNTPDWREFYNEPIWEPEYRKRRHPAPVVTRHVEPEPLPPGEKERRLHAHWTRPSRKAPFANLG